jgi:hypothetical protein
MSVPINRSLSFAYEFLCFVSASRTDYRFLCSVSFLIKVDVFLRWLPVCVFTDGSRGFTIIWSGCSISEPRQRWTGAGDVISLSLLEGTSGECQGGVLRDISKGCRWVSKLFPSTVSCPLEMINCPILLPLSCIFND